MSLHHDPAVDLAMRANLGAGFHFFDPDSQRFHQSRSVCGFVDERERFAYVVERYRTAFMGGHQVQFPHSRVVRVNLKTGETDYLTDGGKPTSEMVKGKYVDNGEACHYSTNARATKAAKRFAGGES